MTVTSKEFQVEGFKELEEVLIQMGEELCYGQTAQKILVPAAKAAMMPVLMAAKANAPYDATNTTTPHLRDGLKISGRVPSAKDKRSQYGSPNDVAIALVGVRTDKRAISQEFGNDKTAPQPYLRSALESQADRVIQVLGSFLTYKLNQYKSKKDKQ